MKIFGFRQRRKILISKLLTLLLLLTSCQRSQCLLEPEICYAPSARLIDALPSAFPSLSRGEAETPWGREYLIGKSFAHELDLYRAITAYKRALVLLDQGGESRRLEIYYHILLGYYLGGKVQEVIEIFEGSDLALASSSFPAFGDLLVVLYDSYQRDGRPARAEAILQIIEKGSPETARDLGLYEAIQEGAVGEVYQRVECHPQRETIEPWLNRYSCESKSIPAAQWLNGLLPGAGYLYVGQRSTALTSFVLNGLFIAAAVQFFCRHEIAAGIITLSLESGWYFGGIKGAGLAAKQYNERLFECYGKELLIQEKMFPALMLECAF